MQRPALLLLLTLAACASERAGVARQPGFDGGWVSADGGTHLDITGDIATLHFLGRKFVFKPVSALNGYIGEDDVGLRGEGLHIMIDMESIAVRERGHAPVEAPLAEIPVGATARYAHGVLRIHGRD